MAYASGEDDQLIAENRIRGSMWTGHHGRGGHHQGSRKMGGHRRWTRSAEEDDQETEESVWGRHRGGWGRHHGGRIGTEIRGHHNMHRESHSGIRKWNNWGGRGLY